MDNSDTSEDQEEENGDSLEGLDLSGVSLDVTYSGITPIRSQVDEATNLVQTGFRRIYGQYSEEDDFYIEAVKPFHTEIIVPLLDSSEIMFNLKQMAEREKQLRFENEDLKDGEELLVDKDIETPLYILQDPIREAKNASGDILDQGIRYIWDSVEEWMNRYPEVKNMNRAEMEEKHPELLDDEEDGYGAVPQALYMQNVILETWKGVIENLNDSEYDWSPRNQELKDDQVETVEELLLEYLPEN